MNATPRKPRETAGAANTLQASTRAAPATASDDGKKRVPRKPRPETTPSAWVDIQLVAIEACCAPGQVGETWWRDAVARGLAPQPVVQLPRFTRWRATEVHAFWAAFAASGGRLSTKGSK